MSSKLEREPHILAYPTMIRTVSAESDNVSDDTVGGFSVDVVDGCKNQKRFFDISIAQPTSVKLGDSDTLVAERFNATEEQAIAKEVVKLKDLLIKQSLQSDKKFTNGVSLAEVLNKQLDWHATSIKRASISKNLMHM